MDWLKEEGELCVRERTEKKRKGNTNREVKERKEKKAEKGSIRKYLFPSHSLSWVSVVCAAFKPYMNQMNRLFILC
jgi:hypothetical protein